MKKLVLILVCSFIAPLAFAQSPHKKQTTTAIEQPVTVTGATIATTEGGAAANYQPFKTLVVNKGSPGRYVLDGPGHVVNTSGEVLRTPIKPGARVRVYYLSTGGSRVLDRVVVD